jgi:hypothetical protein
VIVFDHNLLAQRDRAEMERFRHHLLGVARGTVEPIAVEHKGDDSCCRLEPWPATLAALLDDALPEGQQALIVR